MELTIKLICAMGGTYFILNRGPYNLHSNSNRNVGILGWSLLRSRSNTDETASICYTGPCLIRFDDCNKIQISNAENECALSTLKSEVRVFAY